jgi:hypothetical protein
LSALAATCVSFAGGNPKPVRLNGLGIAMTHQKHPPRKYQKIASCCVSEVHSE